MERELNHSSSGESIPRLDKPPEKEKKKKKSGGGLDLASQAMVDQLRGEGRNEEADELEKVLAL